MTAQGVMNKGKVYIVLNDGNIDSVWDHSEDAVARRDAIRQEDRIQYGSSDTFTVDIITRKVR